MESQPQHRENIQKILDKVEKNEADEKNLQELLGKAEKEAHVVNKLVDMGAEDTIELEDLDLEYNIRLYSDDDHVVRVKRLRKAIVEGSCDLQVRVNGGEIFCPSCSLRAWIRILRVVSNDGDHKIWDKTPQEGKELFEKMYPNVRKDLWNPSSHSFLPGTVLGE